MSWNKNHGDRRERLPADWEEIRQHILERDGRRCRNCGKPGTDVDHIKPGDDHSEGNLQTLCSRCHAYKTSQQALGARGFGPGRRRAPEAHPGGKSVGSRDWSTAPKGGPHPGERGPHS